MKPKSNGGVVMCNIDFSAALSDALGMPCRFERIDQSIVYFGIVSYKVDPKYGLKESVYPNMSMTFEELMEKLGKFLASAGKNYQPTHLKDLPEQVRVLYMHNIYLKTKRGV